MTTLSLPPSEETTKLLTLLNVSATKPGKRKRTATTHHRVPLGGKANRFTQVTDKARQAIDIVAKSAKIAQGAAQDVANNIASSSSSSQIDLVATADHSDDEEESAAGPSKLPSDAFNLHFASEGQGSHAATLAFSSSQALEWDHKVVAGSGTTKLGKQVRSTVRGWQGREISGAPHANVVDSWQQLRKKRPVTPLQQELIPLLSTYADLYQSNVMLEERSQAREAISCHAVSHVIKTRRRILKNNERLAHAAASASTEDVEIPRDQGFTRPKVLILAPMRNTALQWVRLLEGLSGCPQVDNKARLEKEYNLPEGAEDKLLQPEAKDRYPLDHLDTFQGNIDDNFQLGIKLTRKSLRLFSPFYDSDFIVASPLALVLAEEKDRNLDFLSSIEVLVVDQMDVITMQNWEHLQTIMSKLNKIPSKSHDTDFSRVKQWYLDGQAANLRQSVLLSSYEAPEMRALYSHSLVNVAGKTRTLQTDLPGVMSDVRPGIRQSFVRFDCANLQLEHELRFQHFTQKTLPNLLKSAISSQKTLLFVPSYFDFCRLEDFMLENQVNCACISEYTSGKDIARARQQFLAGKKAFLMVTERFHFYRRYVLRGAQTVVFYALPEHPQYFPEVLSFPFAKSTSLVEALRGSSDAVEGAGSNKKRRAQGQDEAVQEEELDPSEVSVQALYSRYDLLRLQRIVGTDLGRRMVEAEKRTWKFT